jgi:hypothetical protein
MLLAGCDLSRARFRDLELADAALMSCTLTGADFTGSRGTLAEHPINVGSVEEPRWIEGDEALEWLRAAGAAHIGWLPKVRR